MRVYFDQKRQNDYPKRAGEMNLAWYNQGQICIYRKKTHHEMQAQNIYIRDINQMVHGLWQELSLRSKRELQAYALQYKKRYPSLRKRGNNAYSVFLMICHSLIRKYQLNQLSQAVLTEQLKQLLASMSIYKLVLQGILKVVIHAYRFNHALLAGGKQAEIEDFITGLFRNKKFSMDCNRLPDECR
ncbi:MAG TPA: hypothetical protein PKJ08_07255, partial [Candidatus Cloacimonadota bacterium]|nr:hypothetical protein [Candidatus Cloacimonadota bacterium]